MQKRQEPEAFPFRRVMISAALGLGLILGLLLLLAVLLEREALPQTAARLCALCAAFVGCTAASFISARRGKLPAALLSCALILAALLAGGGALLSGAFDSQGLLLLCGVAGGAAVAGTALSGLLR